MRALGTSASTFGARPRRARRPSLAMDHPASVRRLAVLDIAPTLAMYEQTTEAFARAYWHWFFLILPAPVPEKMIGADAAFLLRAKMASGSAGLAPFAPEAWAEYERCFSPEMVHASCEDYRAAAARSTSSTTAPIARPAASSLVRARAVGLQRRDRALLQADGRMAPRG
jgi:haloacetate dehalogenase